MRLTVEQLLYLLFLLLAAMLRLFLLDEHPLAPHEATAAWAAWLNASGLPTIATLAPDSALYHSLQSLIFWPATVSDGLARLTPALAGIGVVVLPWWWRTWLGRGRALLLTIFLTFDPWLIYYSRLADGAMLTIFCALLFLTILQLGDGNATDDEFTAEDEQSTLPTLKSTLLPIVLALFLVSGALAWSFLPLLVLFLLFFQRHQLWQYAQRQSLLLFLATLLLTATGWFTDFAGISLLSTSLTRWLTHWQSAESAGATFTGWLLRLLADQSFTFVLGLVGLLILWRQVRRVGEPLDEEEERITSSKHWVWFLTFWLVWGLLLSLAPGHNPLAWPVLGLALIFCAVESVMFLIRQRDPAMTWGDGNLLLAILAVLTISTILWASHALFATALDAKLLQPVAVLLALSILLCSLYAILLDSRQATFIVCSVLSALLLLLNISATWHLNYRNMPMTSDGFLAVTTHPDVRRLAQDIQTISAQRAGDPGSLPVVVEEAPHGDPVLGWYLRTMRQLTWAPSVLPASISEPAPLLVSRRTALEGAAAARYMGSSYRIYVDWQPSQLVIDPATLEAAAPTTLWERVNAGWSAGWRPRLRWLLFREVNSPLPVEEIVLWAP